MIRLTDTAQQRLEKYLQQMRACLRECETVDADEVQRDIIEHIEKELEGSAEPVSINQLDDVLRKLGSPSQWIPAEEVPQWKKATLRLRADAQNWPLAYVALGLFLLFLFSNLIPMRWGLLWPVRFWPVVLWGRFVQPMLLLTSFCLARAAIYKVDNLKMLGARRWLIYPPLVFFYVPLFLFILLLPGLTVFFRPLGWWESILAGTSPGFYSGTLYHIQRTGYLHGGEPFQILIRLSIWWAVLATVLLIWPGLLRVIFRPFADQFDRKWAGILFVIAISLLIACIGPELSQRMQGKYFIRRSLLR